MAAAAAATTVAVAVVVIIVHREFRLQNRIDHRSRRSLSRRIVVVVVRVARMLHYGGDRS